MNKVLASPKRRVIELDLLRGFFIFVIIIDHLQRWPSPFTYLTGEGRLWVSAAEGFFIISGLLIGYIRGYKGLKLPFKDITRTLISRAVKLYIWSVIITFIAVALIQLSHTSLALLPKLPETTGLTYIWQVISQQYVFDWIYFLRMYWMMLLAAPFAVLAFRRGKWWAVPIVSALLYAISFLFEEPEAALQWQVLFFVPATIGFHFDHILNFLIRHQQLKKVAVAGMVIIGFVTMVISYFWVHGWNFIDSGKIHYMSRGTYDATRSWLDVWFTKDPLAIGRVLLSFAWVGSMLALFHVIGGAIQKFAIWLFLPMGTYSLTGYCLQALLLIPVQVLLPDNLPWYSNFILGCICVLIVRLLITQKYIQRILPQ